MKIANVLIEQGFLGDSTLAYQCNDFNVQPGVRVKVPLNTYQVVGFVFSVEEVADETIFPFDLKAIEEVIDSLPLFDDSMYELGRWLATVTCVPLIRALQTMLPAKIKPSSAAKAPKQETMIRLADHDVEIRKTAKMQEFLTLLETEGVMRRQDANKMYSGVKKLVDAGIAEVFQREVIYREQTFEKKPVNYSPTKQQQACIDAIALNQESVSLLFGATGSGKTEIYMNLCESVLSQGKQVLVLVPEIGLTPQMISRFRERLGMDVGIYHSALNNQEKYEQYQRVKQHKVSVLIGTRSAIFLPFDQLGLIVLDEEHDASYKNSQTPFYHARDVAVYLAKHHQCPLILGSATPSFETYARALKGNYQYLSLPDRINQSFPYVEIVDTHAVLKDKQNSTLTPALQAAITQTIARNEQVILLLNRRGYHTIVRCETCNEVILCPHCDIALNFHQSDQMYHCHYCGYRSAHALCHQGHQGTVIGSGMGTQRLEEMVKKMYPSARVHRFDADSTQRKHAHQRVMKQFTDHQIDILIGTQMIAKGIDIEAVTLVGIINADATLARDDYRASETTFELLVQAAGRSGRGTRDGKVIIQTFNPHHYAIQCAVNHDYKRFFAYEMKYRKMAQYPPYTYLISIVLSNASEKQLERSGNWMMEYSSRFTDCRVLGPAPLRKTQDFMRIRYILKGKDLANMINQVNRMMEAYRSSGCSSRCIVDVNPMVIES